MEYVIFLKLIHTKIKKCFYQCTYIINNYPYITHAEKKYSKEGQIIIEMDVSQNTKFQIAFSSIGIIFIKVVSDEFNRNQTIVQIVFSISVHLSLSIKKRPIY